MSINDIEFRKYQDTEEERNIIQQLLSEGKFSSKFLFYPRLTYDISLLRFLQYFLVHFASNLLPSDDALRKEVANAYSPEQPERVLVTLSVRTFFDCYLRAVQYPKGSEILFSGMSIPQMRTIVEHHGLAIRAFDIDLVTFQADVEQARSLINKEKTKMIVVAPCYGTHLHRIKELQQLANEHNIPLFLDLAQAWGVLNHYKDLDADVTAISFGSIKYQTALGGCVATVKDPVLRNKIADIEKTLPVRTWESQFSVILKNTTAVMAANDAPSTAIVRNLFSLAGVEWTEIVNKMSRGFPGPNLIELIRRRPHKSLLKMLALRLGEDPDRSRAKMKKRIMSGWDILSRLPNYIQIVGGGDPNHPEDSTFWLFPMYCRDSIAVDKILHANGIDSALGTSQMCSMGGGIITHENDSQSLQNKPSSTPKCDRFMQNILYLPAYPTMGERGRDIMLKTLHSLPRRMVESPDASFHEFVKKSPMQHAYRSPAVAEMLKDRPLFSESIPRLVAVGAIGTVAVPSMIGFALKSRL